MLTLKQAIEALVFASPKPITIEEIRKALRGAAADTEELEVIGMGDASDEEVAAQLNLLRAEYEQTGRAFQMVEQATGWTIATIAASGQWVRQLYPETRPTRLSGPALETLAIIAYRQPVTRADIEAVRGVAVDGVMQVLLDRGLVKIAGRAELPGRPLLYETTEYFLEHFGLKAVEELPNSDELRRVELPKAEIPAEEPAGAEGEKPRKGRKKKEAAAENGETAVPAAPGAHDAAVSPDAAPADPASDAAVIDEGAAAESEVAPAENEAAPADEAAPIAEEPAAAIDEAPAESTASAEPPPAETASEPAPESQA